MPKLTPSWLFKGRASQSGCLDRYWASLPSKLKLTPSCLFTKNRRVCLFMAESQILEAENFLWDRVSVICRYHTPTCQHVSNVLKCKSMCNFKGVDIRSYLVRNGSRRCPFPTSTLSEPLNRKTQTNAFIIQYNISIQHKFLESTFRFDQMTKANRAKQGLPSTRVRRDAVSWCPHPSHIMPRKTETG